MPTDWMRMAVGAAVLTVLAAITIIIALGHVEQQTSYGLMPLVVALSNVAVMFATWAFSPPQPPPPPPPGQK